MSKEQRHHHFVICYSLIVICYLFFGCKDIFNPQDLPPGYGRAAVTIMGAPARTVFPITAFAKYEYIFTKMAGGQAGEKETHDPVDGYFTLKLGEWQVTVNAYVAVEDTVPAAYGTSGVFNVSTEAIAHIVIHLGTDAEGYGRFNCRITYPDNATISEFKLENLFSNDVIDISGSTEAGEGSVLIFTGTKEDVPAGYYYLTIELIEDVEESRTAGANEVVYIYDNLDSEYSVSFISKDFSHIHEWENWEEKDAPTVTDNGEEIRRCKRDLSGKHPEYRISYATGTLDLSFELIRPSLNAYRVNRNTASGDVYIPAMHRSGVDSPFLPVTEITSFQGSSALENITISASVTIINGNIFQGCDSLTSIYVDADNQYFASEDGILYDKAKTKLIAAPGAKNGMVTLPESVTEIGDYAFYGCSLTNIYLPAGLTSIGNSAFSSSASLASITIPASVTSIGDSAFRYCGSLNGIKVDLSNQYYSSDENDILYNKAKSRLIIAPGAISGSIGISANVTEISGGAFSGCGGLTGITLPNGLRSIGSYAFQGCGNLLSITIPEGVTYIENGTFSDCSSLTDISIPASVTSIGDSAFSYCYSLDDLELPPSVTSIGSSAFYCCYGLTDLTLPVGGLTEIGNYAFYGSGLGNVIIPAGVRSIGSYAFSNCGSLNSIIIPASVTSIGEGVLDNCGTLANIMVNGGNPRYAAEGDILYDKAETRIIAVAPDGIHGKLEIPPSITNIGSRAFINCTGLTEISIPSSVISIGSEAFSGCTSLVSITVNGSNQYYASDDGILYNKTRTQLLTVPEGRSGTVNIPTGTRIIGPRAFYNCTGITTVTLLAGVTEIGSEAFYNCTGITSISIPTGVMSIGSYAFSFWTNSQKIYIMGHDNETAAYTAWGLDWTYNCSAEIIY